MTPTPWILVPDDEQHFSLQSSSLNDDGDYVATFWKKEDADYIMRRLESHAALVAALRELNAIGALHCMTDVLNPCWDERATDIPGKHWGGGLACVACNARAALAQVESRDESREGDRE
jgi:hypothetical protein